MADVKISALPASTVALAGTEVLPIVQSSTTKQVSVANLTAGRGVSALNLLVSGSTSTTPVLGFNAANTNLALGATISGSYLQAVLQNTSASAGASTNYVLSNNLGTDSTYYGEFGMNSSIFSASTPADYFSINNGIYFSGHDGDVSIGSGNGFKTYLAWGTTGQFAHAINATGALGFSTNLGTTPALSGTVGYGTAGQLLTTNGSTAAPSWSSTLSLLSLQGGNNLLTYSQDFTNALWVKGASSVSATLYTAPDGTTTANSFIADGTSARHSLYKVISIAAGTYTYSVDAKAGTGSYIQLVFSASTTTEYANFDLSLGTVGNVGSATTSSIISLGNGWYRCIATITALAETTAFILAVTSKTAAGYELNSLSTNVFLWGAQLEPGPVASTYTPTTTVAIATTNNLFVPSGTAKFGTTIGVGAATPAASGAGITFPATQSASSDVNTLDDYEEGTWTPSLGGNATYTTQTGIYTKVGNLVTVSATITVNVLGTGNNNTISGLPFTSAAGTGFQCGSVFYFAGIATNAYFVSASPDVGAAIVKIFMQSALDGTMDIGSTVFKDGARLDFSCTYRVA